MSMDMALVAILAVLFVMIAWLYQRGGGKATDLSAQPVLPPGVTISATPLLTETDVSFYNLIRLTVQDQYLVFAQVPVCAFLSVQAMGQARTQVLQRMALKRVDFVLVHPGSRKVEQVVQLEDPSPRPHQIERQRVIEAVLDAAGIKVVKVRPQKGYSAPGLAALLGMEPEE